MNATQEVHATQDKTESKNGRQANGRFAPGNAGGPGNPYYRQVAEYKKAVLAVVSIERLKRILDAIAKKAEDGDVAAAKLILQYTLGKPTTSVDPDLVDVDEWHKLQELSRPPREMSAVMNGVPADMASHLTNIAWPCSLETNFVGPFLDGLKKLDERDARAAAKKARAAAAPKPNGGNGAAAPKPNGDNGASRSHGVAPIPNLDFGEDEEWLRRIAREMFAEGPTPNGENGHAAQR